MNSANKFDYLVQYNAWCRNDGNYYTLKRGEQDWNAKIMWKMRTELDFQWDIVQEDIPNLFSDLSNSVTEILADLKRTIIGGSENRLSRLIGVLTATSRPLPWQLPRANC